MDSVRAVPRPLPDLPTAWEPVSVGHGGKAQVQLSE